MQVMEGDTEIIRRQETGVGRPSDWWLSKNKRRRGDGQTAGRWAGREREVCVQGPGVHWGRC